MPHLSTATTPGALLDRRLQLLQVAAVVGRVDDDSVVELAEFFELGDEASDGPIEGVDGFWCDCGWSGNGFAPAPANARSLAEMILGGEPSIDLGYFGWPRSDDVSKRLREDWTHQ